MMQTPEAIISSLSFVRGDGTKSLVELSEAAVLSAGLSAGRIGAVVAATFSSSDRFPALSVRIASKLGLPAYTPAFDINMACSAYPYAVYLASKLSADTGKETLLVDGDAQLSLVDPADHATGAIFSDAVSVCLVGSSSKGSSAWRFYSKFDEALVCPQSGPIRMDGMKVFSFVASDVVAMLRDFISEAGDFDYFAPHQANPYMIRQLGKSLGLENRLLTIPEEFKNPGSSSSPVALAMAGKKGRVLISGFGAGFSAAAGVVSVV